MTSTTVPTSSNPLQQIERDRFTVACRQAAEIMSRPEYNGRLEKAMDFVLSGAVRLHDDGTATVKSGSHTYDILDNCTCQENQQHSTACQHYLAVQLLKRTYARLCERRSGNGHHTLHAQQRDVPAPSWDCHQAPSSCTLKWAAGGIELMLTLRDATDDALFSRIKRVLPKIEEKVGEERQQRIERQQAHSGNGDDHAETSTAPSEEEPYCDFYEVPLKQYSKDGRSWYSHYDSDTQSWCRGR